MKIKKIPMRTCVVNNERFPKNELLRIVRTPLGEVRIDLSGKLNGHGAYIRKDIETLERAIKGKALERHLECEIPNDVYDEIREVINK